MRGHKNFLLETQIQNLQLLVPGQLAELMGAWLKYYRFEIKTKPPWCIIQSHSSHNYGPIKTHIVWRPIEPNGTPTGPETSREFLTNHHRTCKIWHKIWLAHYLSNAYLMSNFRYENTFLLVTQTQNRQLLVPGHKGWGDGSLVYWLKT